MAFRTTLWQAIERQRLRRAGMLGTLLAIWVLGASLSVLCMLVAVESLVVSAPRSSVDARLLVALEGLPQQSVIAVLFSVLSGVIYVTVTTRLSVLPHLISIGARPATSDEQPDTVTALRDMAIAAGVSLVPDSS